MENPIEPNTPDELAREDGFDSRAEFVAFMRSRPTNYLADVLSVCANELAARTGHVVIGMDCPASEKKGAIMFSVGETIEECAEQLKEATSVKATYAIPASRFRPPA